MTLTLDAILKNELRYQRQGACLRCGKCCVDEGCENFMPAAGGNVATCRIFGTEARPDKCLVYPEMPPIVFKGCGYWFIDLFENRKCGYKEV